MMNIEIKMVNSEIEFAKTLEQGAKKGEPIIMEFDGECKLYNFTRASDNLVFINEVKRVRGKDNSKEDKFYELMMNTFSLEDNPIILANGVFYGLYLPLRFTLDRNSEDIKKSIGEDEYNRLFGLHYGDAVIKLTDEVMKEATATFDVDSIEKARARIPEDAANTIDGIISANMEQFDQMIVRGGTPQFCSQYLSEDYVRNQLSYRMVIEYISEPDEDKRAHMVKSIFKAIFSSEKVKTNIFKNYYSFMKRVEVFEKYSGSIGVETKIQQKLFTVFHEAKEQGIKNLALEIMGKDENLSYRAKKNHPDFSIEGKIIKGKYPTAMLGSNGTFYEHHFSYDSKFVIKENYTNRNEDYLDKISPEDIVRVTYGKKVLYNKDEFLKEIGKN